jgi:hypothetical protein
MDLLYNILKITSVVATGLFGAMALLTTSKDGQGKITKWGRVALIGIVLSVSFSLGLFILETAKARAAADKAKVEAEKAEQEARAKSLVLQDILAKAQETAQQQKKSLEETNFLKQGLEKTLEQQRLNLKSNETVLNEVTRGLYPIKDVSIGYQATLPSGNSEIDSYLNQIKSAITSHITRRKDSTSTASEWNVRGYGERGGQLTSISFGRDSSLAPSCTSSPFDWRAENMLCYSAPIIAFYKTPIDPTGDYVWNPFPGADLIVMFSSDLSTKSGDGGHVLEFESASQSVSLVASRITGTPVVNRLLDMPSNWRNSGKIVSLQDLRGAQVIVKFHQSISPSWLPWGITSEYLEALKTIQLRELAIDVGFRIFRFKEEDIKKQFDKDGYPVFSFVFPSDADEFPSRYAGHVVFSSIT